MFVIPDVERNGIVVNLPSMRLLHFQNRTNAVNVKKISSNHRQLSDWDRERRMGDPNWDLPYYGEDKKP